jgi:superfamily I DNA and/or RNA helicase
LQGEEAKVIILSTTRNNKSGSIGFLKMRNRINVMLSRVGFLLDLKLG